MRISGSVAVLAPVLVLSTLLAACSSSGGGSSPATSNAPSSSAAPSTSPSSTVSANQPASPTSFYVSIGDSYAASYQPTSHTSGATTTNGFADDVVKLESAAGTDYTLKNFGCGGATSSSILKTPGCDAAMRAVNGPPYDVPQAKAANAFMKSNADHIGLVTVSIGGNDITGCGADPANAVVCLTKTLPKVAANIKLLLTGVRAAVGPNVKIVGITYPDVFLGELVNGPSALANQSVTGFKLLINPTLKAAYESAGATFVDVTAATGAYGPMTEKTTVEPYGELPTPVAQVCTLTFYCQYQDIHPTNEGYQTIAQLVVDSLK